MNILDTNSSYLYAWYDEEFDKFNIGSKTPDGTSKESYITSLKDPAWWDRHSWGKHKQYILAIDSAEVIKSLEWFALDYGITTYPDRFYNKKNNAHRGDQSGVSLKMKNFVVDFIEGKNKGIQLESTDVTNAQLIKRLVHAVESRSVYTEHMLAISLVDSYARNQVREQMINQKAVQKIRTLMSEDPEQARKSLAPVVIVVLEDGSYLIIDGNTRLEAAKGVRGWTEIPVVFINYTEFGETEKVRISNYTDFGLYANRESFVTKSANTDGDLKRRINNIIVDNGLDLTQLLHVNRARSIVFDKLHGIVPSKKKLIGLFNSFMTDFNRAQAELTYQDNLISYTESFFSKYSWDNYGTHGIATVHIRVPETANAKGIGYILRVMRRLGTKKGAIILYYGSKAEIYNEQQDNWIQDLKETIAYSKLPITVDVLPAFKDK